MPIKHNLAGKTIDRITILSEARREHKIGIVWNCICRCGNTFERPTYVITRTRTINQSCGKCYDSIKHPKEYAIWAQMLARCRTPNHPEYQRYGARGIKVCYPWVIDFLNFYDDMGNKPDSYSLDRINNDGDYTKENCKWSSISEQNATKTQVHGNYNLALCAAYNRLPNSN